MIIFFGDSITRDFPLEEVVPVGDWLNAGVAGETTGQMRLRFGRDVVDRRPALLHLLGGINDLAENQGPIEVTTVAENLAAMVADARAAAIVVVFGLLMPCTIVRKRPHLRPQSAIRALNEQIRSIAAAAEGVTVADYFAPLVDASGGFRTDGTDDGLHPNGRGYSLVYPIARAAIAAALGDSR